MSTLAAVMLMVCLLILALVITIRPDRHLRGYLRVRRRLSELRRA